MTDASWEVTQYKRILYVLLKRLGPQFITFKEMDKAKTDVESATRGYEGGGGYVWKVKGEKREL